ncbi:hypothetical protein EHS13_01655 [Paenibacillus psychroresistens]|uniref:Uncharacterized protein n=1 Tax=Paenibacillus psychroresistens TaxID=1778678 RepID=A0A6B8RE26_9BACL|nr:hypothetical protein [Paenibacillus psychroresistens]QGQ93712.1 hypothetical protein EHS13_01655 [Paenibacillus psychroresistens]
MFKATIVSILILAAILFVYKDSGTTPISENTLPDPTSTAYKNLVEMRKNVGLDTSPEAINRLYAEQGPNPGFAMIGERTILAGLADIEGQVPNIASILPPENYGGIYIKSANHKLAVKLVHSTPELEEKIIALAKFPDSIEFEDAQFTKAELEAAQELLTANINQIPGINSIGADIRVNRLNIGFNLSEQQTVESRKQIEKLVNPLLLAYSFDLPPITF